MAGESGLFFRGRYLPSGNLIAIQAGLDGDRARVPTLLIRCVQVRLDRFMV